MGQTCSTKLKGLSHVGGPFVTPEEEASRKIDRDLDEEKKKKILKILLLGPGESGKSTTLKQMKIIHAEGYTHDDLLAKRDVVYHNLFNGILTAVREAQNRHLPLDVSIIGAYPHSMVSSTRNALSWLENREIVCTMKRPLSEEDIRKLEKHSEKLRTQDIHPIPPEVADCIERVYATDAIQEILYRTENTDVDDAGKYFLENLDRLRSPEYIPTVLDVLKSRVATQGCVQMKFLIKDYTFNVFDVGGQRSQRKKWLHIFDNVHAVLFITSLSEYNQTLAEEKSTNRMRESLNLFGNICKNEFFRQTAIILFLNKMDLFKEKIQKCPLTIVFPRYKGPQQFEESLNHITKRFMRENSNVKRQIYPHVTCATDTKQIQVVIDSVIDVIIQQTMQKIGIQ